MRLGFSILIIFAFFSLTISCKSKTTTNDTTISEVQKTGPIIPGVPGEVMSRLLNECTFIDYIFHNQPFSVSVDEKPTILSNIGYIDINRPVGQLPTDCKPIARKFFNINGQTAYDVDVYLNGKYKFYVFVDKANKAMYANHMTEDGIKYYSTLAQQARNTAK
jgi:hypothetical protein